jgi:hypothetical protein
VESNGFAPHIRRTMFAFCRSKPWPRDRIGKAKLSLVSCPIALYPATSEREKFSFHQINSKTGNRIKYRMGIA